MRILVQLYIEKIIVGSILVLGLCEFKRFNVIFGDYMAYLRQVEVSEQTVCEVSRYRIILSHKTLI